MRALFVTSDWKWTGPAEPMLVLAHALRARGHRVDIVCPLAPDASQDDGVFDRVRARQLRVVLLLDRGRGLRPVRDREDVQRLRTVAREDGYDVVHTWHTRAHGVALRALGWRPRRRILPIVRAHSDGLALRGDPATRWLFGPGADGLVCTSAACAASHAGLRGGRPTVGMAGAVDLQRFRPVVNEAERGHARAAIGVRGDAPLVGVVARVQPHRRFELLFEALRRVVPRHPDLRLLLIGRGSAFDRLARIPVARMGLREHVIFAGHRRGEDFAALLRGLDALCFLVPGSDGSCRAVLEAAASGVPAVATRRGALPEIVEDGRTGWLVDESPDALAAVLGAVASEPLMRRLRGAAARERAVGAFAPERLAADTEALYREVVARHGRG